MKFLQVLDGAEVLSERGNPDIAGVEYDSRRVKPGYLFVAMKGESTDGNRFIDKAIQLGAVAVVSDSESADSNEVSPTIPLKPTEGLNGAPETGTTSITPLKPTEGLNGAPETGTTSITPLKPKEGLNGAPETGTASITPLKPKEGLNGAPETGTTSITPLKPTEGLNGAPETGTTSITPLKPKEGLNGAPETGTTSITPLKPKEGLNGAPETGTASITPLKPTEGLNGAPETDTQVAWATVPHGRRALARVSANFYRKPAERLANTGVTGTNGKTTTAFLIESILNVPRKRTVLIGTIEYHVLGKVIAAPHTTPESLELNRMFAEALANGATETVMEVSSHALEQQRVYGIPYDVAVFTNLTRDHLDYHETMEKYFDSKKILFEGCGTDRPRVAVINTDDAYGRELVKFSKKRGSEVVTYGLESGDFHAKNVDIGLKGTRFDLAMPDRVLPIWSPLIGRVNVYNIMAAAAAAWARGCTEDLLTTGIAALQNVPGRFQPVIAGQPFTVVVDYAHTDDALKNLTALAREFVSCKCPCHTGAKIAHPVPCCPLNQGHVITVFGCGGDRDRAKRPLMGEAAGRGSDFVVITSDNPRSEDPMAIINDAKPGVEKTSTEFVVEPDRRKSIDLALHRARPGDIVLIAGKGHEKTQTTREGMTAFDDAQVAQELLNEMGYTRDQAQEQKA